MGGGGHLQGENMVMLQTVCVGGKNIFGPLGMKIIFPAYHQLKKMLPVSFVK